MSDHEQQLQSARTEAETAIAAWADLPVLTQIKAKYLCRGAGPVIEIRSTMVSPSAVQ